MKTIKQHRISREVQCIITICNIVCSPKLPHVFCNINSIETWYMFSISHYYLLFLNTINRIHYVPFGSVSFRVGHRFLNTGCEDISSCLVWPSGESFVFSYQEAQSKIFCLPVKTICPPAAVMKPLACRQYILGVR